MKRLTYILLLFSLQLSAQTYYCTGEKQVIETMQTEIQDFRKTYESNYQCEKWDIQKTTQNNWLIYADSIDVFTLNLQGCSTTPVETTGEKETSDNFYLIPLTTDENTVLIKRVLGKPMVDKNGNHLPINSIYEVANFPTIPIMGAKCEAAKVYSYEGMLFACVQTHNRTEHSPEIIPALFTKIQDVQAVTCPIWVQPISTNPYMLGECVTFNGKEYTSKINNNVWAPNVYGWQLKIK